MRSTVLRRNLAIALAAVSIVAAPDPNRPAPPVDERFAYRDLAEAVEASGVDPSEFQVGEVPDGLEPADRRTLSRVASKLGATRVVEAANGIEGYSAQVCEEDGAEPTEQPEDEGLPTAEP